MAETTRTTQLVGRPRHLRAGIFLSSLLILGAAGYAFSQALNIDKTHFQPSAEDFPGCKLNVPSSFLQKAINLSKGELEVDIVQMDETLYCIHLRDTKTSNTQSLIISGYDFFFILVPDIMYNHQIVPRIYFRTWFFNVITIAIADGKLVLTRSW
jgi:hypothetical protein